MGAESNRPLNTEPNEQRKTDSAGTKPTGNSGGRRKGTGTGTGSGGKTKPEPVEKVLGLSDVKPPKAVSIDIPGAEQKPNEEKPATNRGRPKGSTTKTRAKAPAKKAVIDPTHYVMLLQTMSAVIGSRPGMQVFMLSKEEATQIATPLASILAKNEAMGEFAGEYADHIALLIACATIMIPKVLIYTSMKKQAKEGVQNERTITGNDAEVSKSDRNTANVQNDGSTFNGSINSILSPVAGI